VTVKPIVSVTKYAVKTGCKANCKKPGMCPAPVTR